MRKRISLSMIENVVIFLVVIILVVTAIPDIMDLKKDEKIKALDSMVSIMKGSVSTSYTKAVFKNLEKNNVSPDNWVCSKGLDSLKDKDCDEESKVMLNNGRPLANKTGILRSIGWQLFKSGVGNKNWVFQERNIEQYDVITIFIKGAKDIEEISIHDSEIKANSGCGIIYALPNNNLLPILPLVSVIKKDC